MNAAFILPDWPAAANVRAVVTTRRGPGVAQPPFDDFSLGLRSGDAPGDVDASRRRLAVELALPSLPRWLRQVHGTTVARFDGQDATQEREADAAVACVPGVVLAILTADCLPVFFCAGDGTEIAAAHAGWRGLAGGVLDNTLAAMRTPREKIRAWLGPAIGPRSYEVGEEVREAFLVRDRAAASAFAATRPGHWSCDLYALAQRRLRAGGVTQVHGGGFDTFADPRFHSHRRDGARSGRFASLIFLNGDGGN